MKKTILVLSLVLSILLLAGCTDSEPQFTQKDYTADASQIREIHIDVRDRAIEVSLSSDDQIHISYRESSKEFYDISLSEDQVLTMTSASQKDWSDYIGAKPAAENRKIFLQIPQAQLTTLDIATTIEDISLSALAGAEKISLSSNGGNLLFDALNPQKELILNAKNGSIRGTIAGSYEDYAITCDIKKGESNLPALKENGTKKLSVSANNGDIAISFHPF